MPKREPKAGEPTVVKSGHLCKSCGAWVGVENHGTYCKGEPKRKRARVGK